MTTSSAHAPVLTAESTILGEEVTILEELWRIFTYYTMHTNASVPDILKV